MSYNPEADPSNDIRSARFYIRQIIGGALDILNNAEHMQDVLAHVRACDSHDANQLEALIAPLMELNSQLKQANLWQDTNISDSEYEKR